MEYKLLIVDDSVENIQVVATTLQNQNYDLSYALSAHDALTLLENESFDLILLDVMMPVMNGYELCKRIKRMPEFFDVPVIFLTAKSDMESVAEGFSSGGQDYISKPFNSTELLARVKAHVVAKRYKDVQAEVIKSQRKYQQELEQEVKEQTKNIRELSRHQEKIREDEKRHIAGEIHDELGVTLTALNMELSSLEKKLVDVSPDSINQIKSMRTLVTDAAQTARRIISSLRPSILDTMGLVAALEWQCEEYARRYKSKCHVHANVEDVELDENEKIAIFRIAQECLTNTAKHAGASSVVIELLQHNENYHLKIEDNGVGFTPSDYYLESHGINGIKERVEYLGGSCHIDSEMGKGTTIMIDIPINTRE